MKLTKISEIPKNTYIFLIKVVKSYHTNIVGKNRSKGREHVMGHGAALKGVSGRALEQKVGWLDSARGQMATRGCLAGK